MKKLLQYVLMMSALGLQSGVLLAQSEVAEETEMFGQTMDAGIRMGDLQSMLDSEKRKGRRGFNAYLYQWFYRYMQGHSLQEQFTPEMFINLSYEKKIVVLNALMGRRDGVKFVYNLPGDMQNRIVKEAVDGGFFEKFKIAYEIHGLLFIMANQKVGIDSPGYLTEGGRRRVMAVLNATSEKPKSIESKSKFELSLFTGGAFVNDTTYFHETMGNLLLSQALEKDATINLTRTIEDEALPKIQNAFLLGSIVGTRQGRASYTRIPLELKDTIVNLVVNFKPTNSDEAVVVLNLGQRLLQTAKEYPKIRIMAVEDRKSLFLKMAEVVKNNPTISVEKRIRLLKVVKKSNLSAEELDAYAEYKKEVLKAVPKGKSEQVKRFLNDEQSKNDEVDIYLFSFSEKQKDQKSDDAKKVVPEVKDTQKLINNSEQKGVSDRSETYDKEQKKMDKSKK